MPGPFAAPAGMYPALYLYPLNDSFVPKHISLAGGQRVKIGRQTNAKTVPAERNGFFDSKVLSRQHAEVWEEGGKIYIKDVKSSNGTFINNERLSPEGNESDPWELHTEDIVEFGIDIVGEDNKTVVHHKVAAKVACIFSESDAAAAARSEASGSIGSLPGNGFNFGGPGGTGPRRPGLAQQQGLGGMGGMGSLRPPGKSGLTFDHILSKLQGEIQKSRETGAELHGLTGTMGEIHDTLGGNLPQQVPPYPAQLPPVRPPQEASSSAVSDAGSSAASFALGELQEQIRETQSSLAGHADKVRQLEGVLAEHDAIKREVANLRETLSVRASQPKGSLAQVFEQSNEHEVEEEHSEFDAEDDDDIRSVGTAVPHELERVDEEDEDSQSASNEDEAHRAPRPHTPEPGSLGMEDNEHKSLFKSRGGGRPLSGHFTDVSLSDRSTSPTSAAISEELAQRLSELATQLETALQLSRSLAQQHEQAQGTISALQDKVAVLEGRVETTEVTAQEVAAAVEELRSAPADSSASASKENESLSVMVNEWKKHVEGRWSNVSEEWTSERDRLRRATEEWERRAGSLEATVNSAVSRMDAGLERVEGIVRLNAAIGNGESQPRHHGLATPPSPRSLSGDSPRASRARRRRASRSRSPASGSETSSSGVDVHPALESSSSGSEAASVPSSLATSFTDSPRARTKNPWLSRKGAALTDDDVEEPLLEEEEAQEDAKKGQSLLAPTRKGDAEPGQYPLTPKPSFDEDAPKRTAAMTKALRPTPDMHLAQYSSALGMVVLSVAAAAVMYRVKPDFAA